MLAGHDHVGSTIGLARNKSDLGHRGFRISVQNLGPMFYDAPHALAGFRANTRHVEKRPKRNVERVAESHKPGALGPRLRCRGSPRANWVDSRRYRRFSPPKRPNPVIRFLA